METATSASSGHENSVASQAPGELERVRAFLSLHDHMPGRTGSFPPGLPSLARWLVDTGLATDDDVRDQAALAWAAGVQAALRERVPDRPGAIPDGAATASLDAAAREAGIEVRFADSTLKPTQGGVRGGIGRLLAIAFLAERDGTWDRLHRCANEECVSVFYDRSKNRSGRWCSMASCGNQAKVRAYRERRRGAPA